MLQYAGCSPQGGFEREVVSRIGHDLEPSADGVREGPGRRDTGDAIVAASEDQRVRLDGRRSGEKRNLAGGGRKGAARGLRPRVRSWLGGD